MRNVFIVLLLAATMALALACVQEKVESPVSSAQYYVTIDEAMAAQDGRDLPLILDFYTDW
jgi:hypothetical protein